MAEINNNSVCIVGAGSMGIITGYYLQMAGADITYLVRPHRLEQLSRPQKLYSYDAQSLKTYQGYKLVSEPAMLDKTAFRFIVITLDGASLRAEAGLKLVDELGRLYKNTATSIILGSVGVDLRTWFLERSGLAETQVTNAALYTLIYEATKVTLPLHPDVRPELLAQADYAYRSNVPYGFVVDNSSEKVAQEFAALFNKNGVVQCGIIPSAEYKLFAANFPVLMAWELLGWRDLSEIDPADETWQLGTEASKEFMRLSLFGQVGQNASQQTSAEGTLESNRKMAEGAWPLDLPAFFKYHHGGKVNGQDHQILREGLRIGQAEGVEMPALKALVERLPKQ